MSDPLRTDLTRALEPVSDADRDAKIEQLLLAGLEHYFGGEFEEAINVWSRALFLDRGHARARAYIERARSAQAERQRESEELLQRGVAALRRGESAEALRLLRTVMAEGVPSDEAVTLLERLSRLEHVAPPVPLDRVPAARSRAPHLVSPPRASKGAWAALAAMALVIVTAATFALGAFRSEWGTLLDRRAPANVAPLRPGSDQGLPPLPLSGETALIRAQALVKKGLLHDALTALDAVRATDAQKAEADRLRADLQKQLIELDGLAP